MDAKSFKETQHETWTAAAAGWRRNDAKLRAFMAPVAARMVRDLKPGQRVLDVASGTGEPALEAAARVGPNGSVLGTDFVPQMLELARETATGRGLRNVEFRVSDGEMLDLPEGAFDAATMRFGLMFMPDPLACLTRVHRALKPGGALIVACWAGPEENPWASILMDVLRRHVEIPEPPPGAPGLFAFADPNRLRSTATAAGFRDATIDKVSFTMVDFPSGKDFVTYQLDLAGPIAHLFEKVPESRRQAVLGEMANEAEQAGGIPVRLLGLTWILTAIA
jgi:SAM-dependent methyltransferase